MQTGRSRTDVGFVHQNWTQGIAYYADIKDDNNTMNWQLAHQGVYYRSTELQDNGYTYDYFSPRFLFDDDVRFDERTKTIEQSGYKAIVLYQKWLDLEGAKRILSWAKKGLKVVVLEDAGSRTPGNDGKDVALKKVMDELKGLSTVRQATVYDDIDYFSSTPGGYDDNVMEKLQELGVEPYAGYPEPNLQLLTQTREDEAGNRFMYVFNYGDDEYHPNSHKPEVRDVKFGKNITTDVEVEGTFVPYVIDAWTGEVTELADYSWEDGRTVVPVDLDQHDIELLAFEKVDEAKVHVTSTDAASARTVGDGFAVRVQESGVVETELSNGVSYRDDVTVPESYDITDWDLTVESWRPGATAGDLTRTETIDGLTTTNRKTSTAKTQIDVELEKLTTWDKIPQVGKAVSGTGHYEATFEWDADSASGAYLDFGDELQESMKVWINGRKVGGDVSTNPTKVKRDVGGVGKATIDDGRGNQVPLAGKDLYTGGVSWIQPQADVSEYLVDGTNEIVIEYASALSNVQLDRGVITEQRPITGRREKRRWGNDQVYLAFGPQQAKVVPFVELEYAAEKPVEPEPGQQFSDVPPSHSFFEHISWLVERGLVKGFADGTFRPSSPVTRGQLAVMLYKYAGSPEFTPPATSPFTDLPTTHSFYKHVTWLVDQGLIKGYGDGTFRANTALTRGQTAVVLFKQAGAEFTPPATSPFPDVPTSHSFYRHIAWLEENGIVKGYGDGTFRPSTSVTRGQTAVVLKKYDGLTAD